MDLIIWLVLIAVAVTVALVIWVRWQRWRPMFRPKRPDVYES